jgi:glycosyltransferase involved in cell wall biosynthesis
MMIDVLYLAWNRREYTEATFEALLENTDWGMVSRLCVYDDGSEDGTYGYLAEAITDSRLDGVEVDLRVDKRASPPAYMNLYVDGSFADWFAKIDNDIMVPPGWLDALVQVVTDHPEIDLLGMEGGRCGYPQQDGAPWDGIYGFEPATHIGGVGLMKVDAFRTRNRIVENGRYGFTEWQHTYGPTRGWIIPDLMVTQLDLIPFEPWKSLADTYRARGWQRPVPFPSYDPHWARHYWAWWAPEEAP